MEKIWNRIMIYIAASSLGAAITMPICGFLIIAWGWESVFYVTGLVGVVWSIAWFLLIFDSPSKHPRISDEERTFIEEAIGGTSNKGKVIITTAPLTGHKSGQQRNSMALCSTCRCFLTWCSLHLTSFVCFGLFCDLWNEWWTVVVITTVILILVHWVWLKLWMGDWKQENKYFALDESCQWRNVIFQLWMGYIII